MQIYSKTLYFQAFLYMWEKVGKIYRFLGISKTSDFILIFDMCPYPLFIDC